MNRTDRIPLNPVDNNHFESEAGDAGFVDFKSDRQQYRQALLDALLPLHVVRIAHHGGANAHFYHVLGEARFPEQTGHAYLLLSHATKDISRPSREFRLFVEEVRRPGQDVRMLLTSKPRHGKVAGFADLIAPVTAPRKDKGDVQMLFTQGAWTITQYLLPSECSPRRAKINTYVTLHAAASRRPSRTGTLLRRLQSVAHGRFSGTLCLRALYAVGLIEKAADFRDVPLPRGELGPRLQGCNAGHATFRLRRGDILRKRPA